MYSSGQSEVIKRRCRGGRSARPHHVPRPRWVVAGSPGHGSHG